MNDPHVRWLPQSEIHRLINTFAVLKKGRGWCIPVWLHLLARESGVHSSTQIPLFWSINWREHGLQFTNDKFVVVPKQGGSIELTFRVGTSDIDESEAGWLFGHLSQELWITLTAPPKTEGEPIDGTTGHPGADGQGSLIDPEEEGEDGEGDTPEEALAATQE